MPDANYSHKRELGWLRSKLISRFHYSLRHFAGLCSPLLWLKLILWVGQKKLTEKPILVDFALHIASLSLKQRAGDLLAEETPGHIVKESHLLAQLL